MQKTKLGEIKCANPIYLKTSGKSKDCHRLVCSGRSANNQLALGIDSMGSGFLCFAKPAASWRRYYKYIAYFHIGLVGVR
jgi:hypothetical protein